MAECFLFLCCLLFSIKLLLISKTTIHFQFVEVKDRNEVCCYTCSNQVYILNMDLAHKMMKSFISLTPKGYERVDQLQKNFGYGKSVLVAMKFGDDTKPLREAIRQGIQNAGYIAVFIDEVQHNGFIRPELLNNIHDSKFVVADLTHQNNGAYFEERYDMRLGKLVIQLCMNGVKLHFDIVQKNTIMWETESDIPERLTNRIKATID